MNSVELWRKLIIIVQFLDDKRLCKIVRKISVLLPVCIRELERRRALLSHLREGELPKVQTKSGARPASESVIVSFLA